MFDKDIKVNVFAAQRKVQHIKAKPRTVSFQVGGDDKGSIATTPNILPPPYVLKLGQLCFQVPPEDDVKPNFCTPPKEFHVHRGTAAKDIYVFYFN
jgi:hypothetical protein